MLERQAASCLPVAVQRLQDMQASHANMSLTEEEIYQSADWLEDEENGNELRVDYRTWLGDKLNQLVNLGSAMASVDTKYLRFREALQAIFDHQPGAKVLVFSFFRGTLDYLFRQLSVDYNVEIIHGGVVPEERKRRTDRFRNDPDVQILLSSEVGAEGLDFQFCNIMFNYDLPWNPMRVEQRIGRLDRFGQINSVIHIFNLVIANSIEERIFMRLYDRIRLFQETIGDLEQILGESVRRISREVLTRKLSPQEEQALADEIARNIEERRKEIEAFDEERTRLIGQDAILATEEVERNLRSGHYVSAREIRALLTTFLHARFPRTGLEDNGDGTWFLTIDQDLEQYLVKQPQHAALQDFIRRINQHHSRGMPVTFLATMAYQRPNVEFLNLTHPLVQLARKYWEEQPETDRFYQIASAVPLDKAKAGPYFFYIFRFLLDGVEKQSVLRPLVLDKEYLQPHQYLSQNLLSLLISDLTVSLQGVVDEVLAQRMVLANRRSLEYMAQIQTRQEKRLQERNDVLLEARRAAITQSFEIKEKKLLGYIESARDPRILRMRQAQLNNTREKYGLQIQELEKKRNVMVSYDIAMKGILHVKNALPGDDRRH